MKSLSQELADLSSFESVDEELEEKVEESVPVAVTEPEVIDDEPEPEPIESSDDEAIATFKQITGWDGDLEVSVESFANAAKQLAERAKQDELDEEVRQFAEWKNQGGDLDSFRQLKQFVDYGAIIDELGEEDLEKQEQIVRWAYDEEDDEVVDSLIEKLKDSGKLYAKSVNILRKREAEETKAKESFEQQVRAEKAEKIKQEQQVFTEIKSALDKNNFNNFSIPASELDDFRKLYEAKKGELPIANVWAKLNREQSVLIDYLAYKISKGEPILAVNKGIKSIQEKADSARKTVIPIKRTGVIEDFKGFDIDDLGNLERQFKTK